MLVASICDLGCGTGFDLSQLAKLGFRNLLGIDYSSNAIDVCRALYSSEIIRFEVVDILQSNSMEGVFDVLIDKGTYDAICLNPDADLQRNRQLYMQFITEHLAATGYFVLMSCNFTKEELFKDLLQNHAFQVYCDFGTPPFVHVGIQRRKVTGLVLRPQNCYTRE